MRFIALSLVVVVTLLGVEPVPATGQDIGAAFSERGPRFLLAGQPDPVRVDAARMPLLRKRISLDLRDVGTHDALEIISRESGFRLMYSDNVVSNVHNVTLRAEAITVAAALTEVLIDAGVDVLFSSSGNAALIRRPSSERAAKDIQGTIIGRVTEAETGDPVVNAQIAVDGRGRALTNEEGRYSIDGVEPGRRTVSVTSIGYARASREVEVGDDATATVDFALEVSASQLDQIVVTVTGEQRARELGHVIGRINADSLVKEAPISNITELLTGRVPGLQVFQATGTVGGEVQLQIRTPNSILLGNQPIVIVDGVRYTSDPALDYARRDNTAYSSSTLQGAFNVNAAEVEATSPLNDLNPNDIESIEVVKGPTAATLYGTDAANGVIVITTKRGRPGPARWNAYVRGGFNEVPDIPLPEAYYMWGTLPDGEPFPGSCTLRQVAGGSCVQDSLAVYSDPLQDPGRTIFASAPHWESGLSLSGGTAGLRYYVSGSFQKQIGPLQMPPAYADSIAQARGTALPEDQLRPNTLKNVNLRSNLTAAFERVELQASLGYVRRTNRTIAIDNPYTNAGTHYARPGQELAGAWGPPDQTPAHVFSRTSTDQLDRFLLSARLNWRPTPWLRARAGAGVDVGNGMRHSLERRGENNHPTTGEPYTGSVENQRTQQRATTADLGVTASVRLGRLSSRTSVGAQYAQNRDDTQVAWGYDLIAGGESVGQAANRSSGQLFNETITFGSYAEQTFGLNDRLFLTGALRMDGASNFGQKYEAAAYPKASVSWILSEEPFLPRLPGLDELRLRYAFGVSGQQAHRWMVRPTHETVTTSRVIEGTNSPLIAVPSLGNPELRPERAREHEFGLDAAGLDNRLRVGLSWYRRRVVDQIVSQELPVGMGRMHRNLGLTTARGFEARLHASVLETRMLSWDLSLLHSSKSTLLVDLGDGFADSDYREGYPLDAVFGRVFVGYEDANGDGIIISSEIESSPEDVYLGPSVPPRSQTLSTVFGFVDRRLRLSASFSRSEGNRLSLRSDCVFYQCLALLDPSTPLEEQARAYRTIFPQTVPANYTRLEEVTLLADLPVQLLRGVGVRSATLSVSARNVALWTSFPSGDPGSMRLLGARGEGGSNIPHARTWTFRADLGF